MEPLTLAVFVFQRLDAHFQRSRFQRLEKLPNDQLVDRCSTQPVAFLFTGLFQMSHALIIGASRMPVACL